jgi:hypothetical protein
MLTQEERDTIEKFNSVNSTANKYWRESSTAYNNSVLYDGYSKSAVRNLSNAQNYRESLGMVLSNAQKNRYRYLMQDVDFGKKVQESQKSFGEIFGKTYTEDSVLDNYINAMDSL